MANLKDKLRNGTLDLSMSELEEVPVKEIAKIRQASKLDLSNNRLVSLPKTFPTLRHIVELDLSKNMLEELPDNFGDMRQLKSLDLYSNQISRLPLSLGELKNLKWLDLKENPLTPAVASVAGLCSNPKECQTCARNVVAYLTTIKSTIDEEKQRRINALPAVEPSKDTSVAKKDGKKKKKKTEAKDGKGKTDKDSTMAVKSDRQKRNGVTTATRLKTEEATSSSKSSSRQKDSITRKLCRLLFGIFFSLIALTVLAALSLVTLPLFDQERAESISAYLEIKTGQPVIKYQQLGTEHLENIIERSVLWFDELRIIARELYAKYVTGESLESDL